MSPISNYFHKLIFGLTPILAFSYLYKLNDKSEKTNCGLFCDCRPGYFCTCLNDYECLNPICKCMGNDCVILCGGHTEIDK